MRPLYYVIFCVVSAMSAGCNGDAVNLGQAPEISFLDLSKDTMVQGSLNNDTTFIRISFTDPDGDIGGFDTKNIIITDNRTGEEYDSFSLPELPGGNNGVTGEIEIRSFTTCCIFPDNIPPCDSPPQYPVNELDLTIELVDESGNRSNAVTTPTIILLCH